VPDLNLPSYPHCKVPARGGELQCRDGSAEGEVIQSYPSWKVCENSAAIFIYREKEVSSRIYGQTGDVLAMRKGKSVGFITAQCKFVVQYCLI
jgi:hypothetical protein